MKKNYFFASLLIGSTALLSFNWTSQTAIEKLNHNFHIIRENGSPGGKTGAPGDGTCTSCHAGTVQSGSNMNTITFADLNGAVTSYTPGATYAVTIIMNTSNVKNGFEIVALTPSNTQAGTVAITDATNTKTVSFGGKTRVTQKTAGTALTTWTFAWTAPATNVGNVTFYLATNVSNNQDNDNNDIIYNSQHIIGSTAGINEITSNFDLNANYNSSTNSIALDINAKEGGDVAINLVDMAGKSVQFEQLGKASAGENTFNLKLDKQLQKGIYIVNINVNNNFVTKKIYID
ncbi:MAG: T9SS type A sorting domain-containing protein [Fluviicola sp.]|nr:T9SS type A sorting domain-containing protein [Fluviicola sp.]